MNRTNTHIHVGAPGTFKYSHDTNKDIKLVSIFPAVQQSTKSTDDKNNNNKSSTSNGISSELQQCFSMSIEEFKKDIINTTKGKVVLFSQRKTLLQHLKTRMDLITQIEEKQLSAYSSNSNNKNTVSEEELSVLNETTDLEDKIASLKLVMEKMLDDNNITEEEKQNMLKELDKKISTLDDELNNANSNSSSNKHKDKLRKQIEMIQAKRDAGINKRSIFFSFFTLTIYIYIDMNHNLIEIVYSFI